MPYADVAERLRASSESKARSIARLKQEPKRSGQIPPIRLRDLDDVLAALELAANVAGSDITLDSAAVARQLTASAKAAREALRDHKIAKQIADLESRFAAHFPTE